MSIATTQELVGHAVGGQAIDKNEVVDLKTALFREVKKKTLKGFYQESLEKLQGESPLSVDKLRQVANNIGTKINDETGEIKPDSVVDEKTGTSEANLVVALKNEIILLQKLSDEGYLALHEIEQQQVREIIEKRLKSNSAISKDLAGQEDLKVYIEELINSPAFLPKLKDIVNSYAQEGDLDASFLDLHADWKRTEAEFNEEEAKVNHANDKVKRIQTEIKAYEKDENGVEGDLYQKMLAFKTQGSTPQEDVSNIDASISELRSQVQRLESQYNQTIATPTNETPFAIASQRAVLQREEIEVADLTKKIREEEAKREPDQNIISDLESRLTQAKADLSSAPDDQKESINDSVKDLQSQIETERRRTPPRQTQIDSWKRQLLNAEGRKDAALEKLLALEGKQPKPGDTSLLDRIDSLRNQIRERERELAEKKASINDFAEFRRQYEVLKQQEDIAVRELAEAVGKKGKKEADLTRARQEYERAVNLRKGQQTAFAEKLRSSYGEAAHRVIVDEMIVANNQSRILHDEFEKKSFTDAEKGLNNYLAGERWHQGQKTEYRGIPGFRRKVTYNPVRRSEINNDWKTLMTDGEEALVKTMMVGVDNPYTNPPRKYSTADLDDLFDDEETMGRMKDVAVKSLILKRIQNGGITPEDLDTLTQRQLGSGILDAIRQREDVKKAIEDMDGEGALERHGYLSRLSQIIREKPWLLLSLFGFPFAAVRAFQMRPEDEALRSQR